MVALDVDEYRRAFLKYTRRAYQLLPPMERPSILDVGCGSGVPTMELARLSRGDVIGVDIDDTALAKLRERIRNAGLEERVQALNRSLFELDFPDEKFDIIWCEGAVFPIGFSKALREWGRSLAPNRYFVLHDAQTDLQKKFDAIEEQGHTLLDHFLIPAQTWMDEYYRPLLDHIETIPPGDIDEGTRKDIDRIRKEAGSFDVSSPRNSSVYFITRK